MLSLVFTIAVIICSAVLCVALTIVLLGRAPRPDDELPNFDEMSRHVVWGFIYCNPKDPRRMVPKGPNLADGTTINLRYKPVAIALLFVLVIGLQVVIICGVTLAYIARHPQ
jgi:uncharacterized membrane protein